MQLLLCLVYPLSVLTVHDEHETLRPRVVVSPQRPDLILAADIPDVELHILVCYGLDIEPNYGISEVASQWDVKKGKRVPVGMVVTDWFNLSL